jgi:hypothetical protein
VKKEEIESGYLVSTYALYKNYKLQVDKFENGKYHLSTGDYSAYKKLKLHLVDRGWYDIWVDRNEIEKIWEERRPALDFPFPEGMKTIEEIVF